MSNDDGQRRAYAFLLRFAKNQKTFTAKEFGDATGWAGDTPRTYLGKQLKSVVTREGKDTFKVRRSFIHLREEQFLKRTSQKESILPSYVRTSYDSVLTYEFLMPLTREDLLRQALDRLFYLDTLTEQIKLLGLDEFKDVIQRRSSYTDDQYAAHVASRVSEHFGGYSITHVSGRYRVESLLTQKDAIGKRYVIDETTALVRFIVPLKTTSSRHAPIFNPRTQRRDSNESVASEVTLIRTIFFTIFAEVVVHSVQGEDEIWLLETLDGVHRLYKWEIESV